MTSVEIERKFLKVVEKIRRDKELSKKALSEKVGKVYMINFLEKEMGKMAEMSLIE